MNKLFCVLGLLLAAASAHANQNESETNNDRSESNGPINFPENLTGTLQSDGAPGPLDYWRFTATSGQSFTFAGTVTGGGLGADLAIDVENSGGSILGRADVGGDGAPETLNWTAPAAGTYYLVIWEATGTPNGISNYNINCSINAVADTTPPTYAGTAGILSATRLAGNTTADVTWFQASDNVTPQSGIIYNIYYDTVLANVFNGAPEKTVTGTLTTQISGLNPLATYFVGVRARDAANNADTNTRTVTLAPLPNAVHAEWSLYE